MKKDYVLQYEFDKEASKIIEQLLIMTKDHITH